MLSLGYSWVFWAPVAYSAAMDANAIALLSELGKQLDANVYPRVTNGGLVVLNESTVFSTLSTERNYGRQKERGPAAGSWQGTVGRKRPSGGPRPPGDTTPVVGSGPKAHYEVQLSELREQYPGAQFSHQDDGIWLLTTSKLLPGLRQHTIFLTGISFPGRTVRSWAFWGDALAYPEWIGPRHTNFPDGSICAFEPSDGTWTFGDRLVQLLDIYTLWALRHLYLKQFERWPGYQSVHFPGERILELRADEHCGCAKSERFYGECCMSRDRAGDCIGESLRFFRLTGGIRKPPESITKFLRYQKDLPSLANLVTAMVPQYVASDPSRPQSKEISWNPLTR